MVIKPTEEGVGEAIKSHATDDIELLANETCLNF